MTAVLRDTKFLNEFIAWLGRCMDGSPPVPYFSWSGVGYAITECGSPNSGSGARSF